MSRWRAILMLALLVLPAGLFLAVATVALWETGRFTWLWLLIPVCWGVAFVLARRWRTRFFLVPPPKTEASMHWTPRDQEAWKLVEGMAQEIENIPPHRLTEVQFYVDVAKEITEKVARCYHPKARDPFGSLTIPEVLAAAQLASDDLAELFDRYVPAGHLLTVNHWRSLAKLPGWYETLTVIYWPLSALFAPGSFLGRYAASRFIVGPMVEAVQANVLAWFYISFVHRIGLHAIEMNSGRLRGGATHFRTALEKLAETGNRPAAALSPKPPFVTPEGSKTAPSVDEPSAETHEVVICLAGQVKAGKSSLINALLGERQAATDVLPETSAVERYRLELPGAHDRLVLLDTPGYAVEGTSEAQLKETKVAFQQADLVLLVMDVTSPAREPDARFLREMSAWCHSQPHLKPPPFLGILTHIDLLSPRMEWSPPYDWQQPTRLKEHNIREAIEYNREQLGMFLAGISPLCTDHEHGRVYGVEEWLLPSMTTLLGEARASSLIRALHASFSRGKVQKLFRQFWNAGRSVVRASLRKGDTGVPR